MPIMPENTAVAADDADTQPNTEHPAWCDPRQCETDSPFVEERAHSSEADSVHLSLHDRAADGYIEFIAPYVNQHVSDVGPTLGLYSETVGNDSTPSHGFQLRCVPRNHRPARRDGAPARGDRVTADLSNTPSVWEVIEDILADYDGDMRITVASASAWSGEIGSP